MQCANKIISFLAYAVTSVHTGHRTEWHSQMLGSEHLLVLHESNMPVDTVACKAQGALQGLVHTRNPVHTWKQWYAAIGCINVCFKQH